jgi:ABC-type sulfate transport system substrate-binding protein
MGFAYALRDLDDPARTAGGNRCFTYQEFCATRNKALDGSKLDDYLSRIIDEITFYQTGIKNTSKNTVATTTETRQGSSLITSTSWRVYDTDSWVKEQISTAEMTRLLCR